MSASAVAVSCPRCGGVPDPDGGPGHLARCRQCGVLGRLNDPESRQRLVARARIDLDAALATLNTSLSERSEPEARLLASERLYVPYWRIEAIVAGHVEGHREHLERQLERVTDDQGLSHYAMVSESGPPQKIEHDVQRLHTLFVSACPLTELGLPLLDRHRQQTGGLPLRQATGDSPALELFSPELRDEATVLDPLVPQQTAAAESLQILSALSAGLTSTLLPGATAQTELLHSETTLLYWPLWHLRLAVGSRHGEALIDGVRGAVVAVHLSETDPSGLLVKRWLGLSAVTAGLFCGALIRLPLAPPDWLSGAELGSLRLRLLGAGAAMTYAAWRVLRYALRAHLGGPK